MQRPGTQTCQLSLTGCLTLTWHFLPQCIPELIGVYRGWDALASSDRIVVTEAQILTVHQRQATRRHACLEVATSSHELWTAGK